MEHNNLVIAYDHLEAHQNINAALNAQIIIQNLELAKMSQALQNIEKRNKKKEDRTSLFKGGMGRHLTDQAFIKELESRAQAKEVEERDKEQRVADRLVKKVDKGRRDAFWKEFKLGFSADVARWQAECNRLATDGIAKKDWPKKPKLPLKATVLDGEFGGGFEVPDDPDGAHEQPPVEERDDEHRDDEEFETVWSAVTRAEKDHKSVT